MGLRILAMAQLGTAPLGVPAPAAGAKRHPPLVCRLPPPHPLLAPRCLRGLHALPDGRPWGGGGRCIWGGSPPCRRLTKRPDPCLSVLLMRRARYGAGHGVQAVGFAHPCASLTPCVHSIQDLNRLLQSMHISGQFAEIHFDLLTPPPPARPRNNLQSFTIPPAFGAEEQNGHQESETCCKQSIDFAISIANCALPAHHPGPGGRGA